MTARRSQGWAFQACGGPLARGTHGSPLAHARRAAQVYRAAAALPEVAYSARGGLSRDGAAAAAWRAPPHPKVGTGMLSGAGVAAMAGTLTAGAA